MCLVDQEADSQEDQADHELDDQLLPYKLKPAVKADIDHSQGHQDQANWGDQADVALPPVGRCRSRRGPRRKPAWICLLKKYMIVSLVWLSGDRPGQADRQGNP